METKPDQEIPLKRRDKRIKRPEEQEDEIELGPLPVLKTPQLAEI
jgi:hypothetical protein